MIRHQGSSPFTYASSVPISTQKKVPGISVIVKVSFDLEDCMRWLQRPRECVEHTLRTILQRGETPPEKRSASWWGTVGKMSPALS
jgi:hypothetical protein